MIHGDNDDAFCIVWRPFRVHSFAYNTLHTYLTMLLVESRRLAHTHTAPKEQWMRLVVVVGAPFVWCLLVAVQRLPK